MSFPQRIFEIDPAGLEVTKEAVFEAWGCAAAPCAEALSAAVGDSLATAPQFTRIRAGYQWFEEAEVDPAAAEVRVGGVHLRPGRIITDQLDGVDGLALFAVTLGDAFDRWVKGHFAAGEPFVGYVADTIGSLTVEAATDNLEARIARKAGEEGLGNTRRFSPGYCGWDVAQQHELFALLGEGFCGIRLTPSAMMVPVKSVSGIIGTGPGVEKAPYPCARCERVDCPQRGR